MEAAAETARAASKASDLDCMVFCGNECICPRGERVWLFYVVANILRFLSATVPRGAAQSCQLGSALLSEPDFNECT